MDVLQRLTEAEFDILREEFQRVGNGGQLNLVNFTSVVMKVIDMHTDLKKSVTDSRLKAIFEDIDLNDDGAVTWEEFSMFLINDAIMHSRSIAEVDKIHDYSQVATINTDVPNSIRRLYYIPSRKQVAQVIRCGRATKLCVSMWQDRGDGFVSDRHMESARVDSARVVCLAYIPPLDHLAVSFSNANMSLYNLDPPVEKREGGKEYKRGEPTLILTRHIPVEESQTAMRWNTKYNRLMTGSRSGVVCTWNLDYTPPFVEDSDRLHEETVNDIICHDEQIITASMDSTIKVTDVVKELVSTTLRGHDKGVACLAHWPEGSMLFSAGFESELLCWALKMTSKKPTRLVDKLRPHQGGIVGLFHVPQTFQLITADTKGTVKVWDTRTYNSVTTTTVNTFGGKSPVASFTYIDHRKSILVAGRALNVLRYTDTQRPMDADDTPCHLVFSNEGAHLIVTSHKGRTKSWDYQGRVTLNYENVSEADGTCMCADTRGRRLFVGTAAGTVVVVNSATGEVLREVDIEGQSEISSILYAHIKNREWKMVVITCKYGVYFFPDTNEACPYPIRSIAALFQRPATTLVHRNSFTETTGIHSKHFVAASHDGSIDLMKELVPPWLIEEHLPDSQREKTAMPSLEARCTFLFESYNLLVVVADANYIFTVDLDTYAIVEKIDCESTDFIVTAISLAPQPYVLIAYCGGGLNVVRIAEPMQSSFQWEHTSSSITALGYDAQSEFAVCGDEKGNLTVYDLFTVLRRGPTSAARTVKVWSVGRQPISSITHHRWTLPSQESAGLGQVAVLASCADGTVAAYGLLGLPLGKLSQARGLSSQGGLGVLPLFCGEQACGLAVGEVLSYIRIHRAVRHKQYTLASKSQAEENEAAELKLCSTFFLTEGSFVMSSDKPCVLPRVGVLPRHPAREHPTTLRNISTCIGGKRTMGGVDGPLQLKPTPRPPEERIPASDASRASSFPFSDIYPSAVPRTAYRIPRPPKPHSAFSHQALRYFKELGVHHSANTSQTRRTLRDKGNVVLSEEGICGDADPSSRLLYRKIS